MENNNKKTNREPCAGFAEAPGSADVWRVTADDDPEKQWDSDNSEDAGIDAAFAFEDGARKVTIERITTPNSEAEPRRD